MNASSIFPIKTQEVMKRLMQVALGQAPADLVVKNARVVNVFTGEIQDRQGVAVVGPWIARVSGDVSDVIGEFTRVIEAGGGTLIPGFIDGHTHMALTYTADTFIPFAVSSGLTTVVSETLEFYPVAGLAGVLDFLDSLKEQPIRFFATAPAMVSISKACRGIPPDDLKTLLDRPDVIGIGESYWQGVLQNPDVYLPILADALLAGKVLEGHTAGAGDNKLAAYAAIGVTSCHEPINADQVLSRLRAGFHVMAREGSIRRDLEAISKITAMDVDLRRLTLTTDSMAAQDLLDGKYMDYMVQKAINNGFPPITAIQMATLNVAEHFHLDHILGAIAPGRLADMVLIPEISRIKPEMVICNGKVVFENGRCQCVGRRHTFAPDSFKTVRLPRDLTASDFEVKAMDLNAFAQKVRAMEMVTDLVTRESQLDLAVKDGVVPVDPNQDVFKVAALDRRMAPGKVFAGFIKGFGLRSGAVASTQAWDASDIIVVGCNDADMACAVNRIRALQGGVVLCDGGRVVAEIALPIFGLNCDLPLETIVNKYKAINAAAAQRGVSFPDALLSLNALTGAAIPYLRICSEGLVNLKDGKTLGLFL
jgi:adenine deaminase